jgi:hypothetical protein
LFAIVLFVVSVGYRDDPSASNFLAARDASREAVNLGVLYSTLIPELLSLAICRVRSLCLKDDARGTAPLLPCCHYLVTRAMLGACPTA